MEAGLIVPLVTWFGAVRTLGELVRDLITVIWRLRYLPSVLEELVL